MAIVLKIPLIKIFQLGGDYMMLRYFFIIVLALGFIACSNHDSGDSDGGGIVTYSQAEYKTDHQALLSVIKEAALFGLQLVEGGDAYSFALVGNYPSDKRVLALEKIIDAVDSMTKKYGGRWKFDTDPNGAVQPWSNREAYLRIQAAARMALYHIQHESDTGGPSPAGSPSSTPEPDPNTQPEDEGTRGPSQPNPDATAAPGIDQRFWDSAGMLVANRNLRGAGFKFVEAGSRVNWDAGYMRSWVEDYKQKLRARGYSREEDLNHQVRLRQLEALKQYLGVAKPLHQKYGDTRDHLLGARVGLVQQTISDWERLL